MGNVGCIADAPQVPARSRILLSKRRQTAQQSQARAKRMGGLHPPPPAPTLYCSRTWRREVLERVRAQDVRGAGWRGHAVWGTRLCPCKQIVLAGRGRMRPLSAGAVKRTASGIASEVKSEGPGPDVTGLDTLNRSLAMELRPLGLPPWCVDQATPIATPGQTVSPRGACRRASACESRHWNYPRRDDMRPVSRSGREN